MSRRPGALQEPAPKRAASQPAPKRAASPSSNPVSPRAKKAASPSSPKGPTGDEFIRALNARDDVGALQLFPQWPHRNSVDFQGCTALHSAAERGLVKLCQALLAEEGKGFEGASRSDNHGFTALHRAARSGQVEVVRLLLSHPSFRDAVDAKDNDGHTALHCAALHGHDEVCELLLNAQTSQGKWVFWRVNAQDSNGRTALHCAAQRGMAQACKVIVEHPRFSKVKQKDRKGQTAYDLSHANSKHVLLVHSWKREPKAAPETPRQQPRGSGPRSRPQSAVGMRSGKSPKRRPNSATRDPRHQAPKIISVDTELAFKKSSSLLVKMCNRVRAAAYSFAGVDWEQFFRRNDKDDSGEIEWPEFLSMCRRSLRLTEDEKQLKDLFHSLDCDGSGQVSIEELIATVQDPIGRMRMRMGTAIDVKYAGNMQLFLEAQDEIGSTRVAGIMRFKQFRNMCRDLLYLPDSDVQLKLIFNQIDEDGSGEVCLGELVAFLRGE